MKPQITKTIPLFFAALFFTATLYAQNTVVYAAKKKSLYTKLSKRFNDAAFAEKINQFYNTTCDSLIKAPGSLEGLPYVDVLVNYFTACEQAVATRNISLLNIPTLNQNFLATIHNYKKQPLIKLYRNVNVTQTSILQKTFEKTTLGDSIQVFADLRRMLNMPELIPGRISQPVFAPYKDTLLFYLANLAPDILSIKLQNKDAFLTDLVILSKNPTVKAVAAIPFDNFYDRIIPFSLAIYENRTSIATVKKWVQTPATYYNEFIKEVKYLATAETDFKKSFLKYPLQEANALFAGDFYIDYINELHEKPDNIRFKSLTNLTADELYFLILGGESEMYTSSFIYVYNLFIKAVQQEGLLQFFENNRYYQFDKFLVTLCSYGYIDELMQQMEPQQFARVTAKYLDVLTNKQLNDNEIVITALNIAEIANELKKYNNISKQLVAQIDVILSTQVVDDIFLSRMYTGFKNILTDKGQQVADKETYNSLLATKMQTNNQIVQACLFYDDEDGSASYKSFLASFKTGSWQKKDHGDYLEYTSATPVPMKIFFNKPLTKAGDDTVQARMMRNIAIRKLQVTYFIHRGHSYHLHKSLRQIPASSQLVFLGSCGGFNNVIRVFMINPDAHIIATRRIGSMLINDPILTTVNNYLTNNKNVEWTPVWEALGKRFNGNKNAKELFESYIPPNKYAGILFLREVFSL
ncbi:MAG: hypothetical protein EAZ16_05045 [Sphingobacteriales bacterium]|nr:MAG: hypothetical protein EAZ16_05045 [Sphingobacteriales bacterium]